MPVSDIPRANVGKGPGRNGTSTYSTGGYTRTFPPTVWETSTNLTGGYTQKAVYPSDSILEDYVAIGREQSEAADCFILGSILPVCAALLARRVWLQWGSDIKFPNLFVMLAGKAGDRKSSTIKLAKQVAKACLPTCAFLPENFSPETLFDEYDVERDGRPDKLWIVDDANITITDWQKMSNGERVATRFLSLYDCGDLTESFRRNRSKENADARRSILQTSTSLLFGATFNVACFQGQAVRGGLARRFLYYVADRHGRLITRPKGVHLDPVIALFQRLTAFAGEVDFTPEALKLWNDFQGDNRHRISEVDSRKEAEACRLSSAPMQTLSVAMLFQACVCAKQRSSLKLISERVLKLAIEHVNHNLEAASFLDSIADRETVRDSSEILLSKIRKDFRERSTGGTIFLTRSEITARYAPHSGRQGAWTPQDIFLKFIPFMNLQGDAKLIEKKGKKEVYAFRDER